MEDMAGPTETSNIAHNQRSSTHLLVITFDYLPKWPGNVLFVTLSDHFYLVPEIQMTKNS